MAISKVVYGGNTLIDISGDTVNAARLKAGYTAHNSAGNKVTGTLEPGYNEETLLWQNSDSSKSFAKNNNYYIAPIECDVGSGELMTYPIQNPSTEVGRYAAYKLEFRILVNYLSSDNPYIIFTEEAIQRYINDMSGIAGETKSACFPLRGVNSSGNGFYRPIFIKKQPGTNSSTGQPFWEIFINKAQRLNVEGTNNNVAIPLALYGLN